MQDSGAEFILLSHERTKRARRFVPHPAHHLRIAGQRGVSERPAEQLVVLPVYAQRPVRGIFSAHLLAL
jgi:hypothetical protein